MGAYVLEDKAHISTGAAVASVAAPVGVFLMAGVLLIWLLTRRVDATHAGTATAAVLVCVASVLLAQAGRWAPRCCWPRWHCGWSWSASN